MSRPAWPKIKTYTRKWQAQGETRTSNGYMIDCRLEGKRIQEKFKTETAAKDRAKELRLRRDALKIVRKREEQNKVRVVDWTDQQRTDGLKALDLLEGKEGTLTEAVQIMLAGRQLLEGTGCSILETVRYYVESVHVNERITVEDLRAKYMASKHAANLAPTSIHDYDRKTKAFAEVFGRLLIPSVTTEDLQAWLMKTKSPSYRNKLRHHLVLFFNYAVQHGYSKTNPARRTVKAKVDSGDVAILTPEETLRIMRMAETYRAKRGETPELVPYFAVSLFAGLRPDELNRIDWKDIRLETQTIRVRSAVSKNFARVVEMSDNLVEWLMPYQRQSGSLKIHRYHGDKVKAAIETYPHDGARHSFGTYHLALHQNEAKTLQQMGHRDRRTFMAHYNGLATKQDAEAYFAIRPSEVVGNVLQLRGGAA